MRKFLLGVLLLPALAIAEPVKVDKTVICDNVQDVLLSLSVDSKENPVWFGTGEGSRIVLMINEKSKSWSIVQYNKKIACILATGEGFDINVEPPKRNNK